MNRNKVELLAPAGNMAAFYAAIEYGADAIYCGGKQFSARASAQNFTLEEMAQAVSYAHVRGKKVYVTLNILLSDVECKEALDYARSLYLIGVDGIILQDLGMSDLIAKYLPDFERHASTQMSVMDAEGARYLESLGFSRVVVGREIDLAGIRSIKDETDLEIEAFCHGALCVSISGQCEMSSYIGARSGNRGNCAQPCRKSYSIEDADGNTMLERAYILSPRDLRTIDFVDELKEAGVYSFKLEGRMKSPEYVAAVTHNYHRALGGESYDLQEMAQLFNRSYTRGVGFGDFGERFITSSRPNHRGVIIGEATGESPLWKDLPYSGDLLELIVDGKAIRHTFDEKKSEAILAQTADAGSEIRRLSSVTLEERFGVEAKDLRGSQGVCGYFYAHIGEAARFCLSGAYNITVESDDVLEEARSATVDVERIRKNLSKFDTSAYFLESVEMDIDDHVFLPISLVNRLRRKAIAAYEKKAQRKLTEIPFNESFTKNPKEKTLVTVEVADESIIYQLPYHLIDRLELYFLPSKEAMAFLNAIEVAVFYSFPYETPKGYDEVRDFFDGGIVQNLGQLRQVKGTVVAGEGLNIFNSYSFRHFQGLGGVMPSFECKREQLEDFYRHFGTCGEILYYGYPRSMTMRHCPMSLIKGCGSLRQCACCTFNKGYFLRDEKNVLFPFRRIGDMTEIYNSLPIYLGDRWKQLMALRPSALKIRARLGEDVGKIIVEARKIVDGEGAEDYAVETFTRGHWARGII